jgi:prepilin-type N-terminal cleavage/methylation domain-containing protein
MDMSQFRHKQGPPRPEYGVRRGPAARARGFTLLEMLIAMTVMTVGVVSLACVLCKMGTSTDTSRYISMAAVLTSDKLEDLNRYPSGDAAITVSSGSTAGSLSSDTAGYYDEVLLSTGAGSVSEINTSVSGGNTVYTTISQTPTGEPPPYPLPQSSSPPTTSGDTLVFKRRWLIEANVPVSGVNRFTVLVTLPNSNPPISFQMTMVRGQ